MDLGTLPQEIKDHILGTAGAKFDRPSEFPRHRTHQPEQHHKTGIVLSKNEVLVKGYPVGSTHVTEFVKLNPDKTWNATSPSEQFMVNGVNQFLNHLSWRGTPRGAYGPHTKDEWAGRFTDNPMAFAAVKVSDFSSY